MGSCFSQEHSPEFQTAKVISINGELHGYKLPVTVGSVLASENFSSSSSSFVLCNSDKLYYEEYIPALESTERLVENQIYFVLPRSRLQHKLTAPDMAALAVKASVAMQKAAKKGGARQRISPVLEVMAAGDETEGSEVKDKSSGGLERSGTARQIQRSSSRTLKKAVRSFRVRLSTIQEAIARSDELRDRRRQCTNSTSIDVGDVTLSSGNSFNSVGTGNYCFCGLLSPQQTSWTRQNPGRRFHTCPRQGGEGRCSFFKRVDPAMSDCAKEVILELRDQLGDKKKL